MKIAASGEPELKGTASSKLEGTLWYIILKPVFQAQIKW